MLLKWIALSVVGLAGLVLPAAGQTVALSYSGSGTSGNNSNAITGTGTGTIAGSAGTVTFTGLTGSGGQCDNSLLFSLKEVAANGTDTLTTSFYASNGGSGGDSSGALTLSGALTVTAGTGVYAGKGGSGTATLSVTINKTTNSFTYTFTGSVTLAGTLVPIATVNPSGVVPVNSDLTSVQSGSWVSIYGSNFASTSTIASGSFPTSLGSVTVTFDGKPGFLWFVSSGQINVQVPDDTKTGCVPVILNTPNGTVTSTVDLEPIAPALNVITGNNGKTYAAAAILTPNGSGAYGGGTYDIMGPTGNFPYSTRPAKKGEVVELFGVGFGPVKNPVAAGQPVASSSPTTNQVQVFANVTQTSATVFPVSFSGLVGQGLYQINITIPQTATTGDSPMQVIVSNTPNSQGTQISNDLTIYMSIQ